MSSHLSLHDHVIDTTRKSRGWLKETKLPHLHRNEGEQDGKSKVEVSSGFLRKELSLFVTKTASECQEAVGSVELTKEPT